MRNLFQSLHVTAAAGFLVLAACVLPTSCGDDKGNESTPEVAGDLVAEATGEARPEQCAPGATSCIGNTVWTCADNGIDWVSPLDCEKEQVCHEGACCFPQSCLGKECGDDGCGTSCGSCDEGLECKFGLCKPKDCIPQPCGTKECGDDGCGGTCGECTPPENLCCEGMCCATDCSGKECGDDGCCGSCGDCEAGSTCLDGLCCIPDCTGKECGDDGCGASCGQCPDGSACQPDGLCCIPDCTGKDCGDDGCGGSCGQCEPWLSCAPDGRCTNYCKVNCEGRSCGPDSCGGACGECSESEQCTNLGQCVAACKPDCKDKECGSDGCFALCPGTCIAGGYCTAEGTCKPLAECTTTCDPWNECGPNGCNGVCGTCQPGVLCTADKRCGGYCSKCDPDAPCSQVGFEIGNFTGWYYGGFGAVVQEMGGVTAPEGSYVALLTSTVGKTGLLGFENCLPGPNSLGKVSFKIRFLSEEFMEHCGSIFQDSLSIYLQKGIDTMMLFSGTINDFCPPADGNGGCAVCGKHYTSLTQMQGFQLDKGNVFITEWMDVSVDVSGFLLPGEPFQLHVKIEDAIDAQYDSGLFLDDVRFELCQPSCAEKQCGDDGCGGACGSCADGTLCVNGLCECQVQCEGKVCGDNGCGGSCGGCDPGLACIDGACIPCTPSCSGKECGPDGCAGSCGECPAGKYCSLPQGVCLVECVASCQDKECGDDGCGGDCGDCDDGNVCTKDKCNPTFFICNHLPADGPCDDGDPETENDTCKDGTCKGE